MARSKSESRTFWANVFNCVAFIAVAMIGIALMLVYIFNTHRFSGTLLWVAQILAYVVVSFYSLFYAMNKPRGTSLTVHMVLWAISVVLILVFVILNIL